MAAHFMAEHDAAMHTGRVVAMQERVLTIDEFEPRLRWKGIPYAAIDFGSTDQGDEVEILDASSIFEIAIFQPVANAGRWR